MIDCGLGRVVLNSSEGYISTPDAENAARLVQIGALGDAETFQWTETLYGDLILMSLATQRHLRVEPATGQVFADHPRRKPDRKDGSCFRWSILSA